MSALMCWEGWSFLATSNGVKAALGKLDETQVHNRHRAKDQEEAQRQRGEPQGFRERGKGKKYANERTNQRDNDDRRAWLAPKERYASGPDEKNDEGLGGKRFHEPSAAKFFMTGMKHSQQDKERHEVKQ
jgi:hypothetical protein